MDVNRVLDYNDYRLFLKDWMAQRRNALPHLSMRWLAKRIGIDSGFFVHVLQGDKHLSETWIPALVRELGLEGRDAEYFRELVLFNKARNEREISERFQRLCDLRDLQAHTPTAKQFRYWSHWRYPAVRVLLMAREFRGDFATLAASIDPPLTPEDAEEAVRTLMELDLVRRREDGVYEPLQTLLSAGEEWKEPVVRQFQDQTMELARRSLQVHESTVRSISTLTLSVPARELETLQEMVRQFRSQVLCWASAFDDADSVIQVNLQAFPLSDLPGRMP